MRLSTIVGAAIAVVVVAVVVVTGLRWQPEQAGEEMLLEEVGSPQPGSGQFFQAIPAEAPSVSPVPSVVPLGSPASEAAGDATITMSEEGFSPATVTVTTGATVTFVNNGQAAHWPASGIHPTHQLLPAFDAKQGLGTGDTYSYTFTKAGTWRCHDHLMPQFTCTIVVQ